MFSPRRCRTRPSPGRLSGGRASLAGRRHGSVPCKQKTKSRDATTAAASRSGDGGAGNRTRVRESFRHGIYVRIRGSGLAAGRAPRRPADSQPRPALASRRARSWLARAASPISRRPTSRLGPGDSKDGLRQFTQPEPIDRWRLCFSRSFSRCRDLGTPPRFRANASNLFHPRIVKKPGARRDRRSGPSRTSLTLTSGRCSVNARRAIPL